MQRLVIAADNWRAAIEEGQQVLDLLPEEPTPSECAAVRQLLDRHVGAILKIELD